MQEKAAEDESDAEDAEPSLRKVVSIVFDVRIYCHPDASDDSYHDPYGKRKRPGIVDVMDEGATDEGGSDVADRADDSSPKLTTCKSRTARKLNNRWLDAYRESRQLFGRW